MEPQETLTFMTQEEEAVKETREEQMKGISEPGNSGVTETKEGTISLKKEEPPKSSMKCF